MRRNRTYTIADAIIIDKMKRSKTQTYLDKIDAIIEWGSIEEILEERYRWTKNAVGHPAYPPLKLFKALLVQRWEKLSDPQLEFALRDRFSVMRFVGFGVGDDTPDHSTFSRFRKRLLELGVFDELLEEINRQLEERGLMVRERKEVVVDASVVETYSRPRKVVDTMAEDRKEEEGENRNREDKREDEEDEGDGEKIEEREEGEGNEGNKRNNKGEEGENRDKRGDVEYCCDPDARWLKKGRKSQLGYKCFLGVEPGGYIMGVQMFPANESEMKKLKSIVEGLKIGKGWSLFADKGYASKENREYLRSKGIEDWIMEKRVRGQRELEGWQKWKNREIKKIRYVVEQVFGLLKRHYEFARLRYITLPKARMEGYLVAMAYNLKKAARMVSL